MSQLVSVAGSLQVDVFKSREVRRLSIDGSPWWVAKDVAESLGYNWQSGIVSHVPELWKGIIPINTLGGIQNVICLSEQGLYFFLGRSDKPGALHFQMWIAGEVIPSIRRNGSYSVPQTAEEQALTLAKALIKKDEENKQLQIENQQKQQLIESQAAKIEADAEKVLYAETVGTAVNSVDIGIVAKNIQKYDKNCGKNRLMKFLRNRNILMSNNVPYEKYSHYFEVLQVPKSISGEIILFPKTQVKPKGQQYIINKWFKTYLRKEVKTELVIVDQTFDFE